MERDARFDGMNAPIALRRLGADDWRLFRAVRLEALGEAPYAFGSTLASWQGEGDDERRWRARISEVPLNVVAHCRDRACGMVSATAPNDEGETELISMWVRPSTRGTGVADALVGAVIRWAGEERIEKIALNVIESNERARAFYRRHGFVDQGPAQSAPDGRPERRMLLKVSS
jgi:ribosomal protein S18 acetylase RimI-like enzyme